MTTGSVFCAATAKRKEPDLDVDIQLHSVQPPAQLTRRQRKTDVPQLVPQPVVVYKRFREFEDRILKGSHDRVNYHVLKKHERTVLLPFLRLDDSVKLLTKSDVRRQLKGYLDVFEDPNSWAVLEELRSVVCGTTKLKNWLQSTGRHATWLWTYVQQEAFWRS